MNDTVYYISEASKKVEVEPHVLRYWEDELKLPIGATRWGTAVIQKRILKRCDTSNGSRSKGCSCGRYAWCCRMVDRSCMARRVWRTDMRVMKRDRRRI